jgi:hypothetical protein
MKEFKVGQTILVSDAVLSNEWCLESLHGKQFEVIGLAEPHEDEPRSALVRYRDLTWHVPPAAATLVKDVQPATTFQRVAEMNTAFGNAKGDPENIDWDKIRSQFKNVFDEYCEGLIALGYNPSVVADLQSAHTHYLSGQVATFEPKPVDFRDAVADIKVFADGCSHLAGYDGDADMHTVVDAVFTRFIKSQEDKEATQALHAGKGVTDVYFEGEYPKMVMKSARDQPDAPKGKFLKSASYSQPVFS